MLISGGVPGPAVSRKRWLAERANAAGQIVSSSARIGADTIFASCMTYGRWRAPKRSPAQVEQRL